MKNIAIIMTGNLPVPSIKGGAVETLIDVIIKENEKNPKFNYTIHSIYNLDAIQASEKYRYSKFIYHKVNMKLNSTYVFLSKLFRKMFGTPYKSLYIKKVIDDIKINNYDLIILEGEPRIIRQLSKEIKTKTILHLHSDSLNNKLADGEEIINLSTGVITVSDYITKRVVSLGNEYLDKVYSLKNCADVNAFDNNKYKQERERFRQENNISVNEKLLVFCGRITPEKGVKELLEAFKKVENSSCKLLIVGSTWFSSNASSKYLEELYKISNKIQDRVIFTGYVPHSKLPEIFAAADVAIVPSIWDEPAGLVAIEAMASRLPIIATDSGGLPEYVNEECCILVERNDNLVENLAKSIDKLVTDDNLIFKMGVASRKNSLQYNTQSYFNNFDFIINKIIGDN